MSEADLLSEALDTFERLFEEALAAGEPDRTAMTLATATRDGRSSARTVLLKAHDARRFVFYTHLDGCKLRDGVHEVIVGPANAGKSSLLNALAVRIAQTDIT